MLHKWKLTQEEFYRHIVAQDDDNDYEESGYVVLVFSQAKAAIARYGHCSCYGTWDALTYEGCTEGDVQFDWSGSLKDLLQMALRKGDPVMPDREANPEDYDYDHLCKVYEQVLSKYHLEALMFEQPE